MCLQSQVTEAILLGRATFGKIRQNLGWALMYNVVGIPLAGGALLPAFGIAINASTAGAMMAFSSLAVLMNSLSLRATFGWSLPPNQGLTMSMQPDGDGRSQNSSGALSV